MDLINLVYNHETKQCLRIEYAAAGDQILEQFDSVEIQIPRLVGDFTMAYGFPRVRLIAAQTDDFKSEKDVEIADFPFHITSIKYIWDKPE